jgi:Zn-dependent protease
MVRFVRKAGVGVLFIIIVFLSKSLLSKSSVIMERWGTVFLVGSWHESTLKSSGFMEIFGGLGVMSSVPVSIKGLFWVVLSGITISVESITIVVNVHGVSSADQSDDCDFAG